MTWRGARPLRLGAPSPLFSLCLDTTTNKNKGNYLLLSCLVCITTAFAPSGRPSHIEGFLIVVTSSFLLDRLGLGLS